MKQAQTLSVLHSFPFPAPAQSAAGCSAIPMPG